MIDLHSHILPGLDDGARDLEGALGIARDAVADGITAIAATPHVRGDYPTTADEMQERVAELRAACAREGISLEVLTGGELDLEEAGAMERDELARFGLGGNPSCLLLETPYSGWPFGFGDLVFRLTAQGFRCVIAHPERNPSIQADPAPLEQLVGAGALVQVTAASLDGRLGRTAQAAARRLIDRELVHLVASDAHSPGLRAVGLSSAVNALDDPRLGRWLTEYVPRALVTDTELPPRPPSRRRGLSARLRGR